MPVGGSENLGSLEYDGLLLDTARMLAVGILARPGADERGRAEIVDEAIATSEKLLEDLGIVHPDLQPS